MAGLLTHRNGELVSVCCVKLLSLWEFVMQQKVTDTPLNHRKTPHVGEEVGPLNDLPQVIQQLVSESGPKGQRCGVPIIPSCLLMSFHGTGARGSPTDGFHGGQVRDQGQPRRTNLLPSEASWGLPSVIRTFWTSLPTNTPPHPGPRHLPLAGKSQPAAHTYRKQLGQQWLGHAGCV